MTDPHTQPGPGWYADPRGDQRWWDGARWTEQTLPPPPAPPAASSSGGVARILLVAALALGVGLLVALVVLDVVLLAR